ncbi:MAG: NAD(P)/FAD-dependent oxidoreductase, partial [Pyrinomonadaceae bacterium]
KENRIKVGENWVECSVALWATGVAASPLGKALNVETDRAGRVLVNPDLTIPEYKNVFVIGDMVSLKMENGSPVPGVAPAAMQMAETACANITRDLENQPRENFRYKDKGSMATIGRNKAIAEIGKWKFSGYIAWLMWLFVHIISLIGFRNRLSVMTEWMWAYFTRERSARLITGDANEMENSSKFLKNASLTKIPDTHPRKETVKEMLR